MGNTHGGLEIHLVFVYIILVMMAHKCVGGGNFTTGACSDQERLALINFKHSIKDDHGMLSSWGFGNDCCRWEGVGCEDITGKVVSLHLRKNSKEDYSLIANRDIEDYAQVGLDEEYLLVGDEVNSCLKELVNLKHLDLSGNDFQQSQIPEFIGSFKQLRYLNLSDAGFKGIIPHQIGNLSNLKVLDLNSYIGHPQELITNDIAWISGLSKLEHLDLSGVNLNRTQNIGNLIFTIPSLSKLSLSGCGLSLSHIRSRHLNSSRELASIKHLDLRENDFRGRLPDLVMNMTSLVFLDLSNNLLSMAWRFENFLKMIPSVSNLHLLGCGIQKINLYSTNFNSSTHSSIQHLDLSENELEGAFPSVLTNMSSLLSLDLSINSLSSSIPFVPNLLKLDISANNFRQAEDVGIWRQCHLKELIVTYNDLEGDMISPLTNVSECSQNALESLYLDNNNFNCSIPDYVGKLINLRNLDLSRNQFGSSIPESINKLTNLRYLDLSFNDLIGPIPKELGLTNLRHLDISFNKLSGPIPESLGNLRSLQGLYLSYNQLNGCIPESLERLTALTEIFLESNQLTGPIPVSLEGLTSLRVFSVSSNFLNGTIPNSIGQLIKLHLLDVSNNTLQGVVSEDHFANLSMLKYLNANYNNKLFFNISHEWIPPFQLKVAQLGSCKIEDGFPQWFRTQRKLEELVLSNASISGSLPTWLRLMPIVPVLDLSHNKLTGPLTNLPSKGRYKYNGILLLQNNLFTGLIPRRFCTWTNLYILDLSRNRLTGNFPTCLWNLSLNVMLLGSNRLSGVIPSPLGLNPSLEWLQLSDNNFNGEFPRDFGYLVRLIVLDLGENKISGNIPEWIGENLTMLGALRLHTNNFVGRIPRSLCHSQKLQILDLAHNNLTGFIPRCFGELDAMKENSFYDYHVSGFAYGNMMQVLKGVTLEYTKTLKFVINMDLSSNKLVGEIPEALTSLVALMGLNLSCNHFSGVMPKNIGNMKSLNSLDLSANELTGMIPTSMAALNFLSHLNLSHNNLSGQIPTGNQLQTFTDPSIYANNTYLCGAPLPKECYPYEKPPTTIRKNKNEIANGSNKVWFYLDIMSGFATGFWGIIGVLLFKKQWRHKLFTFFELTMNKIYKAVLVVDRVLKMRRGWEAT